MSEWPLGPEVKRLVTAGSVMLYDASRVSNLTPSWFEPRFWLDRGEVTGVTQGRGATYLIESEGRHVVLRHYRRGGLMANVWHDRYLWRDEQSTRPFAEWYLLYHLHRGGLPVPAPIAARYRRLGRMYVGDIILERLVEVESLTASLTSGALPLLTWIAIGKCIRRFHDLGVCHADLNAHNVLLGAGDSVYLIDFDRGSLRKPGLWCDGNLVRLRRSLEKVTYGMPADRFTEVHWNGLLTGYLQSSARASHLQA